VQFTASCGATEFFAGETAAEFVARADAALYQAKRQGKNRTVVKSPSALRTLLRKVTGH
jgi:PleD family two-component response regulator